MKGEWIDKLANASRGPYPNSIPAASDENLLITLIVSIIMILIILAAMWCTKRMGRYGFCCCIFSCCDSACKGPPCQCVFVPMSFCFPCKKIRKYVSCQNVSSAEFWTFVAEVITILFGSVLLVPKIVSKFALTGYLKIIAIATFAPLYVVYLIYRIGCIISCCMCKRCNVSKDDDDDIEEREEEQEIPPLPQPPRRYLPKTTKKKHSS